MFEYQFYMPFSTVDNDNSTSECALSGNGAWWWAGSCVNSGLNGAYGVVHEEFPGNESIVATKMMIRPISFRSGMDGRWIELETIVNWGVGGIWIEVHVDTITNYQTNQLQMSYGVHLVRTNNNQ